MSYSEVTLIFKEKEGERKRGQTELKGIKRSPKMVLENKPKKKKNHGEGKKKGKTKPRGTDIHFGKVAPKTLMPVFNTSRNVLSLVKMHVPPQKTASKHKIQIQLKKYTCNHGAVV